MNGSADLTVLMHGHAAARLSSNIDGGLSIAYADDYMDVPAAVPLSLSMPFTDRAYGRRTVERWVHSLLPDNPNVLSRWYAREDVRQRSPFGLLSTKIGFDCAGAVQFCPAGAEDLLADRASGIDALSTAQVERELDAVVADPDAWHSNDVEPYFSLGGFQSKIALHRVDGGWGRPYGNVPTTHIFKPRSRAGAMVAVGEHLCLSAAGRLGLNTAPSHLERHGTATALVVERYDRAYGNGLWARIHQEDLCQALGLDGNRKYEHSGGPGMSQIGDLLRQNSTDPDKDLRSFADALIYSWLVINRDAHARNYSIVHTPSTIHLAPLYDVNSSLMFRRPKIGEANMAMRYGSTFTVYSAGSKQALGDMAKRLRLPPGELAQRAEELASGLPAAMDSAIRTLPDDLQTASETEEFAQRVQRRTSECLASISAARKHIRQTRSASPG
ncbi:HipA domain-containing protein [Candidatus Poriferisodalis sp.]|uniref:HipA domain-containing protein n=1 Tax=Candidatus Poriferisodalis sp. TaxID=3101277 RepID=UPI003AF9A485